MNAAEIDKMAEALSRQTGKRCTVSKSWDGDEMVFLSVQIRMRADASPHNDGDWQHFTGWTQAELVHIRDKMADFIAEHRRKAA